MNDNPHRLPRHAIPHRYDIALTPDLEAFTFAGAESIELEITEEAQSITLNAAEIEISSAVIETSDSSMSGTVSYDEALQRATIEFERAIPVGEATMRLEFTGILNDQLHGFYRSTFTDVDGNEQVIATTQFEATDARRAFPCFDEPDFKAVFGVTLTVPDHLEAFSNSEEVDRHAADGEKVTIRFADTMKMSTYLVAFVVGPFEVSRTVDVDGVPLRVVAPKGKLHLTDFALECGEFCLRFLADYYSIPYPGDKVDMVAIPDFAFGAMENLGCITFRETALLVDENTATQAELVRILDVIAHELAHMWFGDLVTMGWWDGIWLNEAFATFMEIKATDAMRPEWERWMSFSATERPWAYGIDALASTRPVEFEVLSPDEANEMFDALTYGKGSSVLRQIEQYLGEETFRAGVETYLKRHAYGNTVTADLWEGLDDASGVDVGSIMDTWILQGGFPQVEVTLADDGVRLTQRRFLSIPDESDQTLWKIPIHLRGEVDGEPFTEKILLEDHSTVVRVERRPDWVIANAGGQGYYRVTYSPELMQSLLPIVSDLEPAERFAVINDAWAFVESGQLAALDYLELALAYSGEENLAIWQTLLAGLGSVRHHIVTDDALPGFRRTMATLLASLGSKLGWDPKSDDSDLVRRLRGTVLGALGQLAEDPAVIERSREIAGAWMAGENEFDPEVLQAALFTMAAHGGGEEFAQVLAAYEKAETPQYKLKLMQALTTFDDHDLVDRTIDKVVDGTIRSQDASWVIARSLTGRRSGPHAWEELRKRWEDLTALMPPMTLRRLMEGLPALSQADTSADVQSFFRERQVPSAAKTLAQNLERNRVNAALRERESETVSKALKET